MAEDGPVEIAPGITVSSRVRFGKPVIKGTRVDVATVLGHLAARSAYLVTSATTPFRKASAAGTMKTLRQEQLRSTRYS